MQAVKEKLQDFNAARKAKAEARAEEKVCRIRRQEKNDSKKKKKSKLRHCLNHYRQFNTPFVSLQFIVGNLD